MWCRVLLWANITWSRGGILVMPSRKPDQKDWMYLSWQAGIFASFCQLLSSSWELLTAAAAREASFADQIRWASSFHIFCSVRAQLGIFWQTSFPLKIISIFELMWPEWRRDPACLFTSLSSRKSGNLRIWQFAKTKKLINFSITSMSKLGSKTCSRFAK